MRQRRRFRAGLQFGDDDAARLLRRRGIDEHDHIDAGQPLRQFRRQLVAGERFHAAAGFVPQRLRHHLPYRVVAPQRIAVADDEGGRGYSAAAFIPLPAASSACDRSPMMSSMCSMPIDSRM